MTKIEKKPFIVFCPNCKEELCEFFPDKGGEGFDPELGTTGWASGTAKCLDCGWTGEYQDQWP